MINRPEISEENPPSHSAYRRSGEFKDFRDRAGTCPPSIRSAEGGIESIRQRSRRFSLSLCDIAAGMSTYACEVTNVTQCAGINFVRGINSGTIYVESNIVYKGRHTAVCRVDITGEEEELLVTGNFTMFLGKEI